MKRKFSQDSDRWALFLHLKLVLPFVSFHFEVSSFLTYRCSAARPYLHVDSQARVSGATVLPAAVLPTIASETGALPPVWARRVCAWMLITLCRFCCCLINWRNTRITVKWVALLFFYLYKHLKGPGKQFTLSTSKKNWNSMLWHEVILQTNLKYSFSKLSLLLSLKKGKEKENTRIGNEAPTYQ